jgi:hypothetical protein
LSIPWYEQQQFLLASKNAGGDDSNASTPPVGIKLYRPVCRTVDFEQNRVDRSVALNAASEKDSVQRATLLKAWTHKLSR